MGTLGNEGGEIHLPERWAVLEEALRQMNAEGLLAVDTETIADTSGEAQVSGTAEEQAGIGIR